MRVWGGSALVLTAGGVGYEVALPVHTMQGLPACGGQVCLYTSLAVREDLRWNSVLLSVPWIW